MTHLAVKNLAVKSVPSTKSTSLNCKRLNLPGISIEADCPVCGCKIVRDFGDLDYLTYPELNVWEPHTMYCDECDEEFDIEIRLTVALEAREVGEPGE